MRHQQSKEDSATLATRIEAAVLRKPVTIQELCQELKFSRHPVQVRLRTLMMAGRVHYIEVATKGGLGLAQVWHPGPAPAELLAELRRIELARERAAAPDPGPIDSPRQATSRTYESIDKRDPLTEALFGPARRAGT